MTKDITNFLLEHFPERDELTYEEFTRAGEDERWWDNSVSHGAYDDDDELEKFAFGIISRPWPEIDCSNINPGVGRFQGI
jgi:hypothetical protein